MTPGSPTPTLYRTDVAITDATGGRFLQKITYFFPQSAALSTSSLNVRVGSVWLRGPSLRNMSLTASLPAGQFSLHLDSLRPAMYVGGRGYVQLGNGSSYYYSLTDLATRGTLSIGVRTYRVAGISWLDHQWGNWSWTSIRGWTWMAIQLGNGRQFSLFDFRGGTGRVKGVSLLLPNGETTDLRRLTITPLGTWTSTRTGAVYPSGWVVRIPAIGADLRVSPSLLDQELVDRTEPRGSYWEGSGRVTGTFEGKRVEGKSYTELTGYAHAVR
jgi:predicted secreted hydrolase